MTPRSRRTLRAAGLLLLAAPAFALAAPTVGGCSVFPANNYWNTPIDALPLHASSAAWVNTVGMTNRLHADWGNVLADNYGIPFVTVSGSQPLVPINPDPIDDFSAESDPGPYPIPPSAPVEGGDASVGDRHVLVIETTNCVLYELYNAHSVGGGSSWTASSFAKWPLDSNALRPAGWTSADAAGLPIFPGLARYDEAASGSIDHAIRFTAQRIWGSDASGIKYLWPARHNSGTVNDPSRPPMGARFRLKASYNIPASFDPLTRTILQAFKKYGLVLADGGSNWFFQGVSDTRWPDAVFSELGSVAGGNFEVVDTALLQADPNSARIVQTDIPRLANISTRMQVLTGNNVMIAGFVVGGAVSKTVAIVAQGPSLAAAGLTGLLANPTLTLVRSSDGTVVATNDDWQAASSSAQLQALGFSPPVAQESAILATLAPGAYTAIVSGAGGGTGVGIVGVYGVDHPDVPLVNISTRGLVLSGNNVMIAGFIVQGGGPQTVVVTGIGPSLVAAGIGNALADPTLTLVRSSDGAVIASNDDWQAASNASQISAAGFAPASTKESAIMMTLDPGAYTAILSGAGGATGVGIVAVYAVP